MAILRIPTVVYPERQTVLPTDTSVNFTVLIDGDICTKYSLKIYELSTSTSKKTYTSTLSPENYVYDGETLAISVNMTDVSLGVNDYYWTIDLYWDDTHYITTFPYVFYCSSVPNISFSPTVPVTITTQSHEFKGLYSQSENKSIKHWEMILTDSAGTKLKSSGTVKNSNIKYTFDGLTSGFTYGVQISGITENNVGFSTNIEYFNVSYNVISLPSSFIPIETREDGSTYLSWNSVTSIVGTVNGTSSFISNFNYSGNYGLHLDDGSYITFDVEITSPIFSKHLDWKPDSTSFVGEICSVRNTTTGNYIALGYNDSRFYLDRNGSVVYGKPEVLTTHNYEIGIRSDGVDIYIYYRDSGV